MANTYDLIDGHKYIHIKLIDTVIDLTPIHDTDIEPCVLHMYFKPDRMPLIQFYKESIE